MQQWLGLFFQVTKPVLTTLVYTGINSWFEAFQEEIKERQKEQAKRVLDSLSLEEKIPEPQQPVALKSRSGTIAKRGEEKYPELWPLRLSPRQILEKSHGDRANSLRIFLAPPQKQLKEFIHLDLETADLERKIARGLREFLNKNYSSHTPAKTTEFLSGLWNNSNFHGEASIKALFDLLQALPTIILHTEIEGSHIAFNLAYWGRQSRQYSYETIFKFNYQTFLQESVKARVLSWKPIRDRLLSLGKSREELERLGGNCEYNLALVEEAETLKSAGIDTEALTFPYRFDGEDFASLGQFLSICHCLVAGWVADIHYLVNDDIPPHLPVWLPPLGETIDGSQGQQALFSATVSLYQDVLTVLANESSQEVPELALKLVESLMHLSDYSLAIAQIEYSFECWRQQRQFLFPETAEGLENLHSSLSQRDWQYLRKLQGYLAAFPEEGQVTAIREIVSALSQKSPSSAKFSSESKTGFQLHHTVTTVGEKVFSLALNNHGYQLIGQRQDNNLKLWHLDPGKGHLSPTQELTGHSGKILASALCAEGKLLATSDTSDQRSYIKIWHLPSGKLMRTLFGHKQAINALAINLGSRPFLASGSHKIKLWDLSTGESWLTLFGHKKTVSCLAISNDGRILVSGSQDKTIRIWDLQTGGLRRTLRGHECAVNALALSADGQTLISGGNDKTIRLWDVRTGRLLHTLREHPGAVQVLALSAHSQQLLSGCEAGTVNLWEMQTGDRGDLLGAARLQTLTGHQKAVRALAFSADGKLLASSCEAGMLHLWKASP